MPQRLLPTDIEGRTPPSAAHPVWLCTRQMEVNTWFSCHTHPQAQAAYSHNNVLRVQAGDTAWVVPPSWAIWTPSGTECEVRVVKVASLRTLYAGPSVVTGMLAQCHVTEVSPLLRGLIAAMDVRRPLPTAREQTLAMLTLDELRRNAPLSLDPPMLADKRLRVLCERVMADLGTLLTFDALARDVGASARTLARRFRDKPGVSFSQWHQQAVLASTIPTMSQGMPLLHVAQELGYNSQNAFSAVFRRAFGSSPNAFPHRPGGDEVQCAYNARTCCVRSGGIVIAGSSTVNRAPPAAAASRRASPPCTSVIHRMIVNPRPKPPLWRSRLAFRHGHDSNTCAARLEGCAGRRFSPSDVPNPGDRLQRI